jgi:adenosine deaminase
MKKLLPLILLSSLSSFSLTGQTIDKYFESIRNNNAKLIAFFSQMPKGGDLHNHYSGSVYAETYINYVVDQDDVINEQTLEVNTSAPAGENGWVHFSRLNDSGLLAAYKEKLIQKWSVKDYNGVSYPSDKQFFETFAGFGIANKGAGRLDTGLLELKRRALSENVSYIETMFTGIPCGNINNIDTGFNHLLETAQTKRDESLVFRQLDKLYKIIEEDDVKSCAADFNSEVTDIHHQLNIDDDLFTMRYQNYVTRVLPPVEVFKNLVLDFESANTCPLIVGVNIVAPENNDIAMRDYWLHMEMFKYCHKKFPKVKYAMHAGELTLGMVKPEELTWHINAAVHIAGANRIGHGVDMPYEYNSYELLRYMAGHHIPIEINLYSNEFILKVKDDQHPITMYKEFNVPIVICSDDPGVLRSNLTQQYVLLAKRYKDVSYEDIKRYVYNSIDYSFIKEESVKEKLKAQLDNRFKHFEDQVLRLGMQ